MDVISSKTDSDAEIREILRRLFDCEESNIGKQGRAAIQKNKITKYWKYIR